MKAAEGAWGWVSAVLTAANTAWAVTTGSQQDRNTSRHVVRPIITVIGWASF